MKGWRPGGREGWEREEQGTSYRFAINQRAEELYSRLSLIQEEVNIYSFLKAAGKHEYSNVLSYEL